MEEWDILQYGSFTILGEWVREYAQRTSCSNQIADQTLWHQLYSSKLRRELPGWNTVQCKGWGLFLPEHLLYNTAYKLQVKTAKMMVPEHPSFWTLLGSTNAEVLEVTEQVYQGEYVMAPSVLPCCWQEECIKKLFLELAQSTARAGLQQQSRAC